MCSSMYFFNLNIYTTKSTCCFIKACLDHFIILFDTDRFCLKPQCITSASADSIHSLKSHYSPLDIEMKKSEGVFIQPKDLYN